MSDPIASHRRDFLTGNAAARVVRRMIESRIDASDPGDSSSDETAEPYLVQLSRQAMACRFELYLNAGQYPQGVEAGIAALDLVEELEAQLTVYRDTSEIMHLNRSAYSAPQPVEPRLFKLLTRAVELGNETQGAYDVTSGPLSKVWGFYRRAGSIPDPDALAEALARVGYQYVKLDAEAQTLQLLRPHMELNLGSIGKGYALDRSAERLIVAGVDDFLWHGGQSSVLARGRTTSAKVDGWQIGVSHPLGGSRRLATITLRNRALATSGASRQFFRHGGRRYGHILDPRTGWPADQVYSATVVAPTAAEADALSTAFYVLGVEKTIAFCDRHSEIAALLVFPSTRKSRLEIAAVGFAPDEYQLRSTSTEGPA